jgi:DNA-binding PucR family transcriptional regulator
MVAWGAQPEAVVTALAERIDGQLLFVAGAGKSLWAWCGCSAPVDPAPLRALSADDLPAGTSVALGASAPGIEGFGRTHREAMQSFHVAVLHGRRLTRYEDVALEALALNDERLAREFAVSELGPLAAADTRTALLRKTLRIYFLAGQNRAAAAARLSVHERTVGYRLSQAEQLLGHPVTERPQELGVALRIHSLLDGAEGANAVVP